MRKKEKALIASFILIFSLLSTAFAADKNEVPVLPRASELGKTVLPSVVGWGNVLVPGMGATLRGHPARGLLEATLEIGSFYSGTIFSGEGAVTVDGTVIIPENEGRSVAKPVIGHFLQEVGIKAHMFNSFYHYQQATLEYDDPSYEKKYQQPLWKGTWKDALLAPFRWKNLSTAWTYIPIALVSGYLYYDYRHTKVDVHNYHASNSEEVLYGFVEGVTVPLGSSFSEDVFYRGFMQREFNYYTGSATAAVLLQSAVFMFSHQPKLRPGALAGGLFLGINTNHFDGNLEPSIASHFWIDLVSAGFLYLNFRKVQGKDVPLSVGMTLPF